MGRRNQHDVFVIGDEQIAAETPAPSGHDRIEPEDDQAPDATYPSGLDHPLPPGTGSIRPRRWLAAIAIAAVPAAVFALLELSSAGTATDHRRAQTSAPTATVSGPSSRGPAPPAVPASSPDREQSGHRAAPARPPEPSPGGEPEREPIRTEAPVSSPPGISAPSSSPSQPPSTAAAPSPSSGEEQFGFER